MRQNITQNIAFLTIKFVAIDVVGDILYWPIWWYTRGLKKLVFYIYHEMAYFENRLGLRMWLKNLFKPMYGQYDWQGRIISFFMRLVVLVYKLIKFILWIFILFIILFVWVLLLPFSLYQIIFQFWNFFI